MAKQTIKPANNVKPLNEVELRNELAKIEAEKQAKIDALVTKLNDVLNQFSQENGCLLRAGIFRNQIPEITDLFLNNPTATFVPVQVRIELAEPKVAQATNSEVA